MYVHIRYNICYTIAMNVLSIHLRSQAIEPGIKISPKNKAFAIFHLIGANYVGLVRFTSGWCVSSRVCAFTVGCARLISHLKVTQ